MLYIDMWSPLYVAQPSADSDKSPVPITMPLSWLAISINTCVRSLACAFSYVTSCRFGSCPISWKCCVTDAEMSISRNVHPSSIAKERAFSLVRLVVPKQGIETAVMPLGSNCIASKARTVASNAKVESNPPDRPITTWRQPIWANLFFKPFACILSIDSQRAGKSGSRGGKNGFACMVRSNCKEMIGRENLTFW